MSAPIIKIDIENYARLARRMCPDIVGVAIHQAETDQVFSSTDEVADIIGELRSGHPAAFPPDGESACIAIGQRVLFLAALVSDQTLPIDTMVIVFDHSKQDPAGLEEVYDSLFPLIACVRKDWSMAQELDSMADELAERYEELNLVYHTNDEVSFFKDGEEALQNLVQSCADYLNVGLAVLRMKEKDIIILSDDTSSVTSADLLAYPLSDETYESILTSGKPLVFNNPAQASFPVPKDFPFKILACPIPGTGSRLGGILVTVKGLDAEDYTNSDKNLLSVMARKAAKVIQSSYDGLTGLLNRFSFESVLEQSMAELVDPATEHCLMVIDADQLHVINGTQGHELGDQVVDLIAQAVSVNLRDTDVVGRIGGNEIAVLIQDCTMDTGLRIAEKLRAAIEAAELASEGDVVEFTASIGVAGLNCHLRNADEGLKHAVAACAIAKERGRNRVEGFLDEDAGLMERQRRMQMVGTVQEALRTDAFCLYGQTIEPLRPGYPAHLEVLIRMQEKSDGLLQPDRFLPASERYQLMPEIDKWVISKSFESLAAFRTQNPQFDCIYSINLSGQSFAKEGFVEYVIDALKHARLPGDSVCFEITETAAVANLEQAQKFISALRSQGCQFALDDFGAGLSSFAYLKSFDVQYLKIDGELVRNIVNDSVAEAMVASIHQIGSVMGLKTIAEYVESAAIRAKLIKMGVDFAQGYAIDKPRLLNDLLDEMAGRTAAAAG